HYRINLLKTVLAQIPPDEKVVIWARYHYALEQIVSALAEEYGPETVVPLHGDIPPKKRDENLQRWRREARFLVATEGAGVHGLDMTAGSYMLFYRNGFKDSERLPAEDRIHRIGQTRRCVSIDLDSGTGIEERISEALRRKGNALATFRDEVEKVKRSGTRKRVRELVASL